MLDTSSNDPLDALLSSLTSAVNALKSSLRAHGLPAFDLSDPKPHPIDGTLADPVTWYARKAIVGYCHQIIATVQSPTEKVYLDSFSYLLPAALSVAVDSKPPIADIIANAGPEGVDLMKLAEQTSIDPFELRGAMRLLTCNSYFRELSLDRFTMNRSAAALVSGAIGALPDLVSFSGCVSAGASSVLARHIIDKSSRTAKTAFEIYHGLDPYTWLKQHPAAFLQFHHALTTVDKLIDGGVSVDFPWAELGESITLVDVGGGSGDLTRELLKRFDGWRAVLQDRPEVVAAAEKAWQQRVPEITQSGRIKFLSHDFFQPAVLPPAPEGSPYVFMVKRILHNWTDKECVQILESLSPAANPGTVLLIIDSSPAVPCPDTDRPDVEQYFNTISGKSMAEIQKLHLNPPALLGTDWGRGSAMVPYETMLMLAMTNSRGRSEPEVRALLESSSWRLDGKTELRAAVSIFKATKC